MSKTTAEVIQVRRDDLRTVQVMVAEVWHRLGKGHPDYGVLLDAVRRLNRMTR